MGPVADMSAVLTHIQPKQREEKVLRHIGLHEIRDGAWNSSDNDVDYCPWTISHIDINLQGCQHPSSQRSESFRSASPKGCVIRALNVGCRRRP